MKKADLITKVAEQTGLSKADAAKAVASTLDVIKESATAGETVQILGFGTFKTQIRTARVGRNPKTGQPVEIAEKQVVKFKPYF
ncbi:HU family DNA-binding protein [Flavobacterium sp. FlaQc-50]|uniref:HU family DNA-binding protein n=1 Tax=unclassified Flavobacterium TaxID=196869 RepID=UPI003756AE05